MRMPELETQRLRIRELQRDDLEQVHQLLDIDLQAVDRGAEGPRNRAERAVWLAWTIVGYEQQARLLQPPFGERAVLNKTTGELLGLVGLVPCLAPFEQLPGLTPPGQFGPAPASFTSEIGLYYAMTPQQQQQGFAAEASRALIRYSFEKLKLKRVIATTSSDNTASIGVMSKLGMKVIHNPLSDPPWFQVIGVLENFTPLSARRVTFPPSATS